MVYCGKASQGCHRCRTRRIKCDRKTPDCSQCVRIRQECPGYRDPLTLMFRDESSKVIQRAQSQRSGGQGASSPADQKANDAKPDEPKGDDSKKLPHSTQLAVRGPQHPPCAQGSRYMRPGASPQARISSTLEDRGFHFYIRRYLVGHPDEPRNLPDLKNYEWHFSPTLREASAALGLAALSNLTGDGRLLTAANAQYGNALRTAGKVMKSSDPLAADLASRLVVMLAMYELVKGPGMSMFNARSHVAGCAVMVSNWHPAQMTGNGGTRRLLQLCYSMFVSTYDAGMPLSQTFHQCLNFALYVASPEEKPTALLGITIARIIDASSRLRSTVLRDGAPATTTTVTNFITAEAELESWRLSLNETSRFLVRLGPHLPPQAVFEGEYHTYHDLWAARMWNHYRWARILANQTILDLFDKYPVSAQQLLVSSEDRRERQTMITDLARELLVSSPSHWRHPLLRGKSDDLMEECGVVGSGAAGVLIFLNQAVVASCARGVPPNYWDWTYDVLRCVWADMGMEYAVVLMNVMRDHRKPITP